jgi:hypothetical protein
MTTLDLAENLKNSARNSAVQFVLIDPFDSRFDLLDSMCSVLLCVMLIRCSFPNEDSTTCYNNRQSTMDIILDDDDYTDAIMILMEDDSDNEEEDVAEAPMVVH